MRFSQTSPMPESCTFGLVETSFQRAVALYESECRTKNRKYRKPSFYHSDLRSDGFTWILSSSDFGLLACVDPLHEYISLEVFPVAGGSLKEDSGHKLPEDLADFGKAFTGAGEA